MFGLQSVASGANPVNIKKGIDKTSEFLTKKLNDLAVDVKGKEDIKAYASISVREQRQIGEGLPADRKSRCGWCLVH